MSQSMASPLLPPPLSLMLVALDPRLKVTLRPEVAPVAVICQVVPTSDAWQVQIIARLPEELADAEEKRPPSWGEEKWMVSLELAPVMAQMMGCAFMGMGDGMSEGLGGSDDTEVDTGN